MSRSTRGLIALGILAGSIGLMVLVFQGESAQAISTQAVVGVILLLFGTTLTVLHLTLTDVYLRRHLREHEAAQMRRFCRSGWVGLVTGAALLGIHYLDGRVKAVTVELKAREALNRGFTASKSGDWSAAAEEFTEAIRLDPNNLGAYGHRAVAYLHLGELDRAVTDLDETIRRAPDDARARYNRGVAFARKGENDLALIDFAEAIRINPGYAKAHLARSRVHARKGNDVQADADRQRALELDPALGQNLGGGWEV